jgi:hypothetical protein
MTLAVDYSERWVVDPFTLSVIYRECYLSTREISKITGIPKSTIWDRISTQVTMRPVKEALKLKKQENVKIEKETIEYFMAIGWQTKEMSKIFGVNPRTVRRWKSNIKQEILENTKGLREDYEGYTPTYELNDEEKSVISTYNYAGTSLVDGLKSVVNFIKAM